MIIEETLKQRYKGVKNEDGRMGDAGVPEADLCA